MQEEILKKISSTVEDVVKIVKDTVLTKVQLVNENLVDIVKFLFVGKGIIQIGVGIVVGFILMKLNCILVDDLIAPFINKAVNHEADKQELEQYKKEIVGIHFPVGRLIVDVLKVVIIGSIIYSAYNIKLN
jgi:large-conductance mechanosensitive channel